MRTALRGLLEIVAGLRKKYPKRQFTLDGRLVGDIGEILAEEKYDLMLYATQKTGYDAVSGAGRKVQIKATMQKQFAFPCDSTPDYFLALQITSCGDLVEIFNGPGTIAKRAIEKRKRGRKSEVVGVAALLRLNKEVPHSERIPTRTARKDRDLLRSISR